MAHVTLKWSGLFLLWAVLSLPVGLAAQARDDLQLPAQSDVRIIVDISGSMKDTDPENLRQPALRLLARLLPAGATAGVWTFGQYVNMLVPHGEVTDDWREAGIRRSQNINSVALRTNLGGAIEAAGDDYFTDGDLSQTHFILLTDGKVDISDEPQANRAEETRILNTVVGELIEKGATFHPIALSTAADTGFLEALARESGGHFQIAETADSLALAFMKALNTAVPQEQVLIAGNGFKVDQGVREFTALIFWDESETSATRELELVRPDNQVVGLDALLDNVRWARESGYDLITVSQPLSGEWRINGELGEGSRVTVVSDLRMVVGPLPSTFTLAEPLSIRVGFFERQEKITNPDFLSVIEVSLSLSSANGPGGTKILSAAQPPEDGTYRDTVARLPAEGLYTVDVVADGQTFSRKFSANVTYSVPAGAVVVAPEEPTAEPVDSEATEPEPVSEQGEGAKPALAVPVWVIGAAAGGLMVLAGLVWFILRRPQEPQPDGDVAFDALADAGEEADEDIPIATTMVAAEPDEVDDTIPELRDVADPFDADDAKDNDNGEFEPDTFDLSEFDDSPDDDQDGPDSPEDDPARTPDQNDPKK